MRVNLFLKCTKCNKSLNNYTISKVKTNQSPDKGKVYMKFCKICKNKQKHKEEKIR